MKAYCKKADLNKAINNVSHAIPTRTTSKILEGILVEIKEREMLLTATDTTITIEAMTAVSSDEERSFVVPARLFSSIISKLPEEEVMIEYDGEKEKIKIRSGNSSSELISFSSDEFPKIKVSETNNKIPLSKDTVRKLIRKTSFAASPDELNGILTGVLLEIKDKEFRMVAVDSFRMAINNAPVENNSELSVVIPAKLINEVSKIISDDGDDSMSLEITDNKAVFVFENNRVLLNTLNGKFIDYNRIIKSETEIKVRVKREDLLMSLDRASLLASSKNNNLIKWEIKDDIIDISSLSDEGNIEEKVEIIKEGENVQIGFNVRFMMDILKAIDDEEIILSMKDSISPCIITPLQGELYLYLVLPVRIN